MTDVTLRADEDGLHKIYSHETITVPWDEIDLVTATRHGWGEEDTVIIELGLASGEVVEVNPESPGFEQLEEALPRFLPDVEIEWIDELEAIPPTGDDVTLWEREG